MEMRYPQAITAAAAPVDDAWRITDLKQICRRAFAGLALAFALCMTLSACRARPSEFAARVLLDGKAWTGTAASDVRDGLRVIIALDGRPLIELPFGEAHTVAVLQPDGAENVVELTGTAVRMGKANCENQDCVHMGEVTRDNLELRVMGGFIVCLPHKLSVEVRGD